MPEDKPAELSEKSITKAVLSETLQHPLTMVPVALGGVSLVAMFLLNPLAFEFFISAVALSALGIAAWIVNYFLRGSTFVKRYFERLLSNQQKAKRESHLQIRNRLAELREYPEALEAYDELMRAYDKFLGVLKEQAHQPITVTELSKHAETTLDKGMETLEKLAGVLAAMQDVDVAKLLVDKRQLEEILKRDKNSAKLSERQSRQKEATLKRVQALQERIDTYRECETLAHELLASCEQCENALENGFLKLSGRASMSATPDVDDVVASMEISVESVRRVEEMLRNLSPSTLRNYE